MAELFERHHVLLAQEESMRYCQDRAPSGSKKEGMMKTDAPASPPMNAEKTETFLVVPYEGA